MSAVIFFGKDFIFKKNYNTFAVKKGDIVNSISVNGSVVSNLISDLYFDASGKIKKINFQTGDKIKMDDVLAELEAEQEKKHLEQAELLKKDADDLIVSSQLIGKKSEELYNKLKNLEIALGEIQLNNIKEINKRNIKIAKLKIQNIQSDLNNNQEELLSAEQNIKETAVYGEETITKNKQLIKETVGEILSISSSTLIETDNILGIDNKEANNQFEEYLGILKSGTFKNARLVYEQVKSDYTEVNDAFNLLNKDEELGTEKPEEKKEEEEIDIMPSVKSTETLLAAIDNLLFKTRILLNNTKTYELLPNIKRPKGDTKKIFTKDELTDFKSMIDDRKNENSTKIDLLKSQKESLALNEKNLLIAKIKFQNEYDKINLNHQEIEKKLDETQENLIKIKEDNDFLIKTAELTLNEKRKNLIVNEKVEIKKLLNKAKELLLLAQENLSKTKLKVPNNCVITDIKAKVGNDISPSQIFAIAISTQVIAEADILESDINKIKIGQKTIFNFADNLKFEEKSTGEIIAIDQNNKKIIAALDKYSSNIIQFGMPIGLTVIIAQKNSVLAVPQNTIFNNEKNKKTIKILINKKIQDIEIKTGIIGNNNMVEIVSGLKEGEEVIIF